MSINIDQLNGLEPGLYIFHWESGGFSEVAVGKSSNGSSWVAPTNMRNPPGGINDQVLADIEKIEHIKEFNRFYEIIAVNFNGGNT